MSQLSRPGGWRPSAFASMNAETTTPLAQYVNELQKLSSLPTELALQRAAPLVVHLVNDPSFLEAEILPILEKTSGAKEDWYVAQSYEGENR
jgi:hypothetical protein